MLLPKPSEEDELGLKSRPPTAHELLTVYGFSRGFMSSNGVPDWPRAARYVLKDFVKGKLLYCTPPPGENQENFNGQSDSAAKPTAMSNVVLETLARRHLIDGKPKGEAIDRQFLFDKNSGAHTKTARKPGGSGDKKHFKRKQKLRIVYADLQM